MDIIRDILIHDSGALHQKPSACFRHRIDRHALTLQIQHDRGVLGKTNRVERKIFFLSTSWIGIDLGVNEFHDAAGAIPHHISLFAPGRRHHVMTDHQKAMFLARHTAFDHHIGTLDLGDMKSGLDGFPGLQIQYDTARMIAVRGLDHNRQTNLLCSLPCLLGAGHHTPLGYWHATGLQKTFGQVLVARNALGNRTCAVGLRRPYPTLTCAIAKLHKIAIGKTNRGDAPFAGSIHDACRAGTKRATVNQGLEIGNGGSEIKRRVMDGRHHEVCRMMQRAKADLWLTGPDHDLVDAALVRRTGLAKPGVHSRKGLQFECNVLHDVGRPGALAKALDKSASVTRSAVMLHEAGQPCDKPIRKTRQGVGGPVLQRSDIDHGLDSRAIGPDARTFQAGGPQKPDRRKPSTSRIYNLRLVLIPHCHCPDPAGKQNYQHYSATSRRNLLTRRLPANLGRQG